MTTITREKHVIDASGQSLGRVATQAAVLLRGKHKTTWVPDRDMGDEVEIVNADKMVYTGTKADGKKGKMYRHHTGRPGGLREESLASQLRKEKRGPAWVLRHAVMGMLPTNTFRKEAMKRLSFRKAA